MKSISRIRFADTKSPHVRCYGISKPVTNRNESFTTDEPIDPSEYTDKWRATRESARAINRLLAVPGVTFLRFRPYEINVTLASVYDWTDVHEDIIQIVKDEYFKGVEVNVVQSSSKSEEAA